MPSSIARLVFDQTRTQGFRAYVKNLLLELCRINTTPNPRVEKMRTAESQCFRILERELGAVGLPGARLERRAIEPRIQKHPAFSLLHFTKTAQRPKGLSPEETYAGRANLLFHLPGVKLHPGQSVALNSHLDVVAPYVAPRAVGGTVFGRGACDDKGAVVTLVAALKVLACVLERSGLSLNRDVLAMFVVEEETGGNGSLSLALDRELKRYYDSLVVCECTGLKVHPANRGAVWYHAELKPPRGVSPFEMAAFINEELEKEGAAIRAESRHPLFPQRPVQTCHGVIGPFGEHPSRVCGEVHFMLECSGPPGKELEALVRDCLESGLAGYVGFYGDKTKVTDSDTGRPMVERHYTLQRRSRGFALKVFGATGHMGAVRERDGAITKTAHLLRSLLASRERLERLGGKLRLGLEGAADDRTLLLEGGQGFVPTHTIEEVMTRLRKAAQRGVDYYLRRANCRANAQDLVRVTFEKLHNAAFDGNPNSVSVRNALAAARQCGLPSSEPVLGWQVSCDARLFALEYPAMDVLTFGPGHLVHAHSDREQVELDDIRRAVEFLVCFLLRQTGSLPGGGANSRTSRNQK